MLKMAKRTKYSISYIFSKRFRHFLEQSLEYTEYPDMINDLIYLDGKEIEDEDFRITLIDFGSKENMMSFISISKLTKVYKEETIETKQDFYEWFEERKKDDLFWETNRTETKIGRFLSKMLGEEVCDEDVEEFVNLYKSYHSSSNYEMKIVYGDEILKYYNSDNQDIENYGGSLAGSCMNYDSESEEYCKKSGYESLADQLQFYAKNPNVGLLILKNKDSEKIKGRALIWNLKDGRKYIDIPYVDFEHDYYLYDKYAKDNNCLNDENNHCDYMEVESSPEVKSLFCSKGNKKPKFELPYLDTFTFNKKTNKITT